jgi:glycosyltransferase involved in cell wall biosynthesis
LKNDNPLVSVIVPAYNVENYIGNCLNSILSQSYQNMEIIVVVKDSSDKTSEICDSFGEQDERVMVLHQKSVGVAMARIDGIRQAQGEYVAFVDGDDLIEPDMISFMVANIGECQCITIGVFREVGVNYCTIRKDEYEEKVYQHEELNEVFSNMIYDRETNLFQPLTPWIWNKLYVTDIMRNVMNTMNPEIKYAEDSLALYQYLLKCKSIRITHKPLYHYRYREDSGIHATDVYAVDKATYAYRQLLRCLEQTESKYELVCQLQHWYVVAVTGAINERMGFSDEVHIPRFVYDGTENLRDKKVVLYAAGKMGQDYYRQFTKSGIQIEAWVDKNYENYKNCAFEVQPVCNLKNLSYDLIVVAVEKEAVAQSIRDTLVADGVSANQIIWKRPYYTF